jgi:DNA excision repair protein ERCC-2
LQWARRLAAWRGVRDASIAAVQFPHAAYRPGQRELAVAVYRAIRRDGRLFASAPTGIGKTISVLFPAVKSLRKGTAEKIFYLTAKTVGRAIAEQALGELRGRGLRLRSVTLTAREKVCVRDGRACEVATCPLAVGFYDRVKAALAEALDAEALDRATLAAVGERHRVCPYALALEAARWVDVLIGDFNHLFDPAAYLREHFEENAGAHIALVDEAHNLIDRSREMFSAELTRREVRELRKNLRTALPACAKALGAVDRFLAKAEGEEESASVVREPVVTDAVPEELVALVQRCADEAERWLVRNEEAEWREELLQFYFRANAFLRTAELFDERFKMIAEAGREGRVRLFCVDPSRLLAKAIERVRAAVFFSATLTPLEFFRDSLGGAEGDALVQCGSPFPPENLAVLVADDIATDFKRRDATVDEVVEALCAFVGARAGNYLIFFPSYKYLEAVAERLRPRLAEVSWLVQAAAMSEEARADFLGEFRAEAGRTLVACAVMGGIFGEGIDLVGERLIGVAVVGVGLPQVCLERELIRRFFAGARGAGFEFAYQFPGMNRVLQAAGRVIRSETDRGVVLLIDERFGEARYRALMPGWWRVLRVRGARVICEALAEFWGRAEAQRTQRER